MQLPSKTVRLLAATLPLLALLGDLLAALQGEAVWAYLAVVSLGLGALALLWNLGSCRHIWGVLAGSGCIAASLGVRIFVPVPADLRLALGTWLAAAAVAVLLLSGALLEGLTRGERPLLAGLEPEPGEQRARRAA